jgi:hypothetical protein
MHTLADWYVGATNQWHHRRRLGSLRLVGLSKG